MTTTITNLKINLFLPWCLFWELEAFTDLLKNLDVCELSSIELDIYKQYDITASFIAIISHLIDTSLAFLFKLKISVSHGF